MVDLDATLTQEETDFQAKYERDTEEIRRFFKSISGPEERHSPANPYHRLAPEYFQAYLEKRPSTIANQAIERAFSMWGGLKGNSQQIEDALTHLSYEEDVWETVGSSIQGAFVADKRTEDGRRLLESLVEQVIPLKSRSSLLYILAQRWFLWQDKDFDKARRAFRQIVEWDAHETLVEKAKGDIYEIDHLIPGQPVPHFARNDINGHLIDIRLFQGRAVLLDFWATWCKPCHGEIPYLRQVFQKYSSDSFSIISLSLDRALESLQTYIDKEKMEWSHIWLDKGRSDPIVKLFNIDGIPQTYLIDQNGLIAAKRLRLGMIEQSVDALLH